MTARNPLKSVTEYGDNRVEPAPENHFQQQIHTTKIIKLIWWAR